MVTTFHTNWVGQGHSSKCGKPEIELHSRGRGTSVAAGLNICSSATHWDDPHRNWFTGVGSLGKTKWLAIWLFSVPEISSKTIAIPTIFADPPFIFQMELGFASIS